MQNGSAGMIVIRARPLKSDGCYAFIRNTAVLRNQAAYFLKHILGSTIAPWCSHGSGKCGQYFLIASG
jgi:hypothetical protein